MIQHYFYQNAFHHGDAFLNILFYYKLFYSFYINTRYLQTIQTQLDARKSMDRRSKRKIDLTLLVRSLIGLSGLFETKLSNLVRITKNFCFSILLSDIVARCISHDDLHMIKILCHWTKVQCSKVFWCYYRIRHALAIFTFLTILCLCGIIHPLCNASTSERGYLALLQFC